MRRQIEEVMEPTAIISVDYVGLAKRAAQVMLTHPRTGLRGIDSIEDRGRVEVSELPVDGTVFEVIMKILQNNSIDQDGTVGGVMAAFGWQRGSENAQYWAHEIGCNCKGTYIRPDAVATRLTQMAEKL